MSPIANTFRRLLREQAGFIGRVWVGLAMAVALAGGGLVYQQVQTSGVTITCDQSSTSAADFTSDLAAISNGQTLCLTNAVDYGTFAGTTKNITIVAQSGSGAPSPVNATLALNLGSGDNGTVVIDGGRDSWDATTGLDIPTATFATGAANLTVKDFEIDGTGGSGRRWVFDPVPVSSNIVVDHFHAHDVLGGEALFYFDDPPGAEGQNTGITIQRGLFRHFSNDGVKLAGDFRVDVLNNKFMDFHESNSGDGNHTDEVQMLGCCSVVKGNWFIDGDQCLFGDDGSGGMTVTHNVIDNCGQWFMNISGDGPPAAASGSTVAFNTITSRTQDSAPNYTCGNNTVTSPEETLAQSVPDIQNNILQQLELAGSGGGLTCVPVANHHNMLKVGESTTGTGGSNITGTESYAGGGTLSSFDAFSDYCLAGGSDGDNDATDGGELGVCGGDYDGSNYGPPTGEGF